MQKKREKEEKQESKVGNIVGTILIIIFTPLLIIFLTIAIKANINHDKLPDFLGYKPLICGSNSMGNVFEIGDITFAKEVKQEDLKKGDIITFWDSKKSVVITHRINEITKDENGKTIYITKGDMNNDIDEETVNFEQIEGKYVGHIKYVGNLILWLQKPAGLIIAFLVPILICALIYRCSLTRKEIKKERTEKLLKKIAEKKKPSF